MECSLHRAIQGTLAVLTRVRPKDLEPTAPLDGTIRLPFGEFPGTVLLSLATMEQFTHGWDLARATGQSTDLDSGRRAR